MSDNCYYGFRKLERRNYASEKDACSEHLLIPLIKEYKLPILEQVVKTHYSKFSAIEKLLSDIRACSPNVTDEQVNLIRAYITDCGLLFAQTRERGWRYSMTSYRNARLEKNETTFEAFFKEECQAIMQMYSNCVLEHFSRANDVLIQECGNLEHVSLFGIDSDGETFQEINEKIKSLQDKKRNLQKEGREKNSNKKVIAKKIKKTDDEMEELFSKWCRDVRIQIGECSEIVNAERYFQDKIPEITPNELFWYLGQILPNCLGHINNMKYVPRLADKHLTEFKDQINEYQQLDLEAWKPLVPYLRRLFSPKLDECTYIIKNTNKVGRIEENVSEDLYHIFEKYIKLITQKNQKLGEQISEQIDVLAKNISCFGRKSEGTVCLERPEIIFFLIRSPNKNSIRHLERGYSVEKDLGCAFRIPITPSSFHSDKELFLSILEACNKWKPVEGYDEWRKIWSEFLPRIIKCVQMRADDLLIYSNESFYTMMEKIDKRRSLDKWIICELKKDNPNFYHAACDYLFGKDFRIKDIRIKDIFGLFDLNRKFLNLDFKLEELENEFNIDVQIKNYFKVFTDPLGKQWELLDKYKNDMIQTIIRITAIMVNWGRVSVFPDNNIINQTMRTHKKDELRKEWKEKFREKLIHIYTEWMLLQCVIYKGTKDLVECVCLVLEVDKNRSV